jgi:hypothetical protein
MGITPAASIVGIAAGWHDPAAMHRPRLVNELALPLFVCGFVIGGALFGILLRPALPPDHAASSRWTRR